VEEWTERGRAFPVDAAADWKDRSTECFTGGNLGSGDRKISAKISKTQQMLINILSKQATSEKINFWFRLSVLLKFVRYTSCGYVVITGLAVV